MIVCIVEFYVTASEHLIYKMFRTCISLLTILHQYFVVRELASIGQRNCTLDPSTCIKFLIQNLRTGRLNCYSSTCEFSDMGAG
jgi:hypothetical protein